MSSPLFIFMHCYFYSPSQLVLSSYYDNKTMNMHSLSWKSWKNSWIILINMLHFIGILTFVSLPTTVALTLGNETDRIALLALKNQLLYGPQASLASWNDSVQFCEWQGVRCGRGHQRVTVLQLNSQNLAGSISPSIGNLSFLREVTLSDNRLNGNIPREFGYLRRLQLLNLTQNTLQGQIPIELANCSSLQVVILTRNNLSGEIPVQFGYMFKLIRLSLSGNNLVGDIPPSLGNLSSLVHLRLAYNHLGGSIPQSLGSASSMTTLFLGENNLSAVIPTSLYNLSSMEAFDISENHLSGSPLHKIALAFPNLQYLSIGVNQFSGTIPTTISNISGLQIFDIFFNGFSGLVPDTLGRLKNLEDLNIGFNSFGSGKAGYLSFLSSLSNCSQMESLVLHNNRFGGVLTDAIANLSSLRMLYMGRNQISGSIPEGIGNLVSLIFLDLGINFLTGTIPISVANLRNLGRLFLHRNNLYGKIPSFIGNLTQLFDLFLHTNNFEGSIPVTLRNCTKMQNLYLSSNNLSGSIPDPMFSLWQGLVVVNISYNSLTGPFPWDVSTLTHLVGLYVYANKLSGEIPVELGQCSGLVFLHMEENFFEGSIPLSLSSLKALESLDLSKNNLSGAIPLELQNLSNLLELNLSFNQLEGEVPTGGVFRNASAFSIMGNNKLCGGIPEMQLPACFSQEAKKKGNILSLKFIIPIIISILLSFTLTVVLVILWWRRKPTKKPVPALLLGDGHLQVSYKELLQATGGFASSNLIGVGSFGSVYRGYLHQHERLVAVKVLNLQQRGASKSFMAECKALGKVRHRNLLKIVTSCSSMDYDGNDFKALVFDFMPNGNLESWLHVNEQHESRNLNLKQMLDIAIDVAHALDYLHNHCEIPIVHCDLKPSNILLDDDMVAHVGDFGLAKLLSGVTNSFSRDQTNSSAIKGTVGYVAPEHGTSGMVSPEADIYSYGILLLEMVTRKRPTDDMFHDGFNLHYFSKMALPDHVMDIVDSRLLEQSDEDSHGARNLHDVEGKMGECLVSLVRIGVSCSAELPGERMNIKDVIIQLCATKTKVLQTGTRGRVKK